MDKEKIGRKEVGQGVGGGGGGARSRARVCD